MSLKLSLASAKASADAVVSLLNASTTANGQLVIYDGTEPATPETAITTQVALAVFELSKPAFAAAFPNVTEALSEANPISSVLASQSGTAGWFRLLDGDDSVIMQGSVTDGTGNGDVKVSSTIFLTGVEVSVLALTYSQPTYTV